MTVAERIYKAGNCVDNFDGYMQWQTDSYRNLGVHRFVYIDGSVLVCRAYGFTIQDWLWSVEK